MEMPSADKAIDLCMKMIRLLGTTQTPGFSYVLGITAHRTEASRFSWCDETQTISYRHPFDMYPPTASSLLALMDAYAWLGQTIVKPNGSIGVSLNLSLQLAKPNEPLSPNIKELDIRNTMAHLGRNTALTHTDFIDPSTDEIIAFGNQVKVISGQFPPDNMDELLNLPLPDDDYSLLPLQQHMRENVLHFEAPGQATMEVGDTVANGYGSLHVRYSQRA